ncbi:MAG TPA: hypothetical protein VJX66_03550 [Amycolatopsis sp.]|nr:hypothetical protein [Amycolatopsis sp.]
MYDDGLSARDAIGDIELPKPPKAGTRNAALSGSKPTNGSGTQLTIFSTDHCSGMTGSRL